MWTRDRDVSVEENNCNVFRNVYLHAVGVIVINFVILSGSRYRQPTMWIIANVIAGDALKEIPSEIIHAIHRNADTIIN